MNEREVGRAFERYQANEEKPEVEHRVGGGLIKSPPMTRIGSLLLVVLSLALAGCGDSEEQDAGGGGQVAGCLTPGEVSAEVDAIAEGAEGSTEEVEQKQAAIAAVEAEAC